jgi:hypothetical protein
MKSGTSSLHSYLDLHPDVAMSRVKELDFFVEHENWPRGLSWYRQQLGNRKGMRGESSPNYAKHPTIPGVPERMHRVAPDARLIYVVRDPIRRVLSHYVHNVSHGRETRPIDEALTAVETNPYVYASRYYFQIEQYLRRFGRSQLLVLDHRELRDDRRAALRRVFGFLGVDSGFEHAGFDRILHRSSAKGRPTPLARRLARLPAGRLLRRALPPLFETPIVEPRPSAATRSALEGSLRPDADALRVLTGLGFEHWSV